MSREISNFEDVIDSRDVIERIEELETERADLVTSEGSATPETENVSAVQEWDETYGAELASLKNLQSEAEGYAPDWQHGATLVRDSYFTEYAEELLKDCGDLPQNIPHYIEIDWKATARNIRVDYTEVDFDGVSYWVR